MQPTIHFENIPDELVALNNWLVFRYEGERNANGKRSKTPYQSIQTACKAKTNDPETWSNFEAAKKAFLAGHADGIGFCIKDQQILGVDLDHCLEGGKPTNLARDWLDASIGTTYVETTVSGNGLRILYRCTQGDSDRLRQFNNTQTAEIYAAENRYFTVSGDIYDGAKNQLGQMPDSIWPLIEKSLRRPAERHEPILSDLSTDETLEQAKDALTVLNPDMPYVDWLRLGFALHNCSQGSESGLVIWDEWSSRGASYPGESNLRAKWKGFSSSRINSITVGTLFGMAKAEGWQFPIALGLRKPSGRTDNANAIRFINAHERSVRYLADLRQWRTWNGSLWETGELGVIRLMREYTNEMWRGLSTELSKVENRAPLLSFVQNSNNNKQILNAVALAASDIRIQSSSSEFDKHDHLLNCKNGVLDFESGKLLPHDPKYLCAQMANVSFDQAARCDEWEKTIEMVACNDAGLMRYLKMLCGYSCVGGNPSAVLPILLGAGRNGKSTIWLTIRGILGDYAGMIPASSLTGQFEQHPTWIRDLQGKRFVVVEETEESAQLKEATIKRITGSDILKGRAMRQDHIEFEPTHTAWMPTNYQPRVSGVDNGIWRRLKLIPFDADIAKSSNGVKRDFHKALIAEESSGILNWLLEGYQDWKANDFDEPECVIAATAEYRKNEDIHLDKYEEWLSKACQSSPDVVSSLEDLWESFCQTETTMDRRSLSKRLATRYEACRITKGPKRGNSGFRGIELKSLVEPLPF